MSKYKEGDKFIIEIDDVLYIESAGGLAYEPWYLVNGMEGTYFEEDDLDSLERYDEADEFMKAKKDEIKVGDEVRLKDLGLIGVVTRLADLEQAACIMFDDGSATWKSMNGAKKTGRHFPIEDILEQMRSE